ncbi:MAG: hypothetical protein ACR2LM_01205 [Pyrinomonadaceae bacterium]
MPDEKKRPLLVVEVQNDFCPGGALAVGHGDEVVAPLNKLITEFLERGECGSTNPAGRKWSACRSWCRVSRSGGSRQ